ncbi:aryl-phospho-beta-d-glucosidase [Spiroplasma sabaudiense Ar-1343]|uniref:Aryl-phospho-beta-d-glucosidase n=1 Tax=Spiroplasma sabaudiense Ar-1343 TaxID=1276257 RepID=W6A9L4_9MOLU|nr:family 1 glycosylhydrolase [Spiroplasma sabaudiense]AHI53580.1 aryl-phospho-beta-d-glucosidase [Spiroplasma sabaudiense Ar-1343]
MKNRNFIFSASTNAFQIEGGRNLGGRSDSIWDEFTKRNFVIPPTGVAGREINSIDVAADFYHKYKTDARIMNKLGLQGLVYNMDWTRIFPKNATEINPEGIKWHDDMFKTMVENGVQPIPILYHWDTPMWAQIQGGFENPEIVEWFRSYVQACFKYLGKYTDIWFVNDENSTFALSGYLSDYMPPARKDKTAFVKALHHLNMTAAVTKEEFLKAKKLGYLSQDAILGIDHDWNPPIPLRQDNKDDLKACEVYNQWFKNLYLDPNLKGTYPQVFLDWIKAEKIAFEISDQDLKFLKANPMDFIGWNYYRPCYISAYNFDEKTIELQKPTEEFFVKEFKQLYPKAGVKYTDWNWIIDASKLVSGALELKNDYGDLPFMIIENGMGDFDDKSQELIWDKKRVEFLQSHICEVLKAKEAGVNFIGYSLWTYCDIFSPSGGYRKDYGLVSVDFNSPIKERRPKLSYAWYKQVIESKGKDLSINEAKLKQDLEAIVSSWDLYYK